MTKVGKKVRNKHKILKNKPNYMRINMIGNWNRRHRLFKIISWEYRYNIIRKGLKRNFIIE